MRQLSVLCEREALILRTGPTPCFVFWQEVMACYVLNATGADNRGVEKCIKPLEDYNECLYHRKEVRSNIHLNLHIQAAMRANPANWRFWYSSRE
jgi:NADH dehydrogenase (ubiquinone) Fe-S protein 5